MPFTDTTYDPAKLASNPRASLSAWLRYEPLVLAAYAQHPRPYIYEPTAMAASTVVSRIRDAIRGAIAFNHSSKVSSTDLRSWWQESSVRLLDGKVVIGPIEKKDASPLEGNEVESNVLVFDSLSLEEVLAFHLLLSSGRLAGPVIVKSPPDTSLLPSRPNVEILQRPDNSIVLL